MYAGSADLFGPQWDGTPPLPGTLAAGRRAAFGINNLTPIGDKPLLQALGSDQDLERAEVLARTLLLAQFTSAGTPMVSASTLSRKVRTRQWFGAHMSCMCIVTCAA